MTLELTMWIVIAIVLVFAFDLVYQKARREKLNQTLTEDEWLEVSVLALARGLLDLPVERRADALASCLTLLRRASFDVSRTPGTTTTGTSSRLQKLRQLER